MCGQDVVNSKCHFCRYEHVETMHGGAFGQRERYENLLNMWKPRMVIAQLLPYYNENLAETTPLDERILNLKISSRKIYMF